MVLPRQTVSDFSRGMVQAYFPIKMQLQLDSERTFWGLNFKGTGSETGSSSTSLTWYGWGPERSPSGHLLLPHKPPNSVKRCQGAQQWVYTASLVNVYGVFLGSIQDSRPWRLSTKWSWLHIYLVSGDTWGRWGRVHIWCFSFNYEPLKWRKVLNMKEFSLLQPPSPKRGWGWDEDSALKPLPPKVSKDLTSKVPTSTNKIENY